MPKMRKRCAFIMNSCMKPKCLNQDSRMQAIKRALCSIGCITKDGNQRESLMCCDSQACDCRLLNTSIHTRTTSCTNSQPPSFPFLSSQRSATLKSLMTIQHRSVEICFVYKHLPINTPRYVSASQLHNNYLFLFRLLLVRYAKSAA